MDESVTTSLVTTGVVLVVASLLYLVALRVGGRFVKRFKDRSEEAGSRAETLWLMIRRVVLSLLLIVALLMVFSVWDISLAPFLALGTIVGAAIGFGAQDLIKDFIAGFFILAEDQYRVGDTVQVAGTTGVVEDIQFRVTVLRDFEGNAHYVPNGQITVTSNYTSVFAQPVIDVGVAYSEDVDRALSIMGDELQRLAADDGWSERIRGEPEILGVDALDDSAVVLRCRLTTVANERWSVRREALRRIKNRFDAEGIEIPFPQVTVHRRES